jgi:hypothetical protein
VSTLDDITNAALDEIRPLLDGAEADVLATLDEARVLLARCAAAGRQDLLEEGLGRLKLMAERQRVRAVDGQWRALDLGMKVAFRALMVAGGA